MIVFNWLLSILLVIASLVLHELMHIFAIRYFGGKVEKISFFPLGLMARVRGLERLAPWERYVVYGAGAMANLILATWVIVVSRLSYIRVDWMEELAFYNIVLCLFNLIPALPLDGGKILQQFLGNRIGILRSNRVMLQIGKIIGLLFICLGFVQVVLFNYNITLLCAGIYIRYTNKEITPFMHTAFYRAMEAKYARRQRLMRCKVIVIPSSTTLKQALELIPIDYITEFLPDGDITRAFNEKDLLTHIFANGLHGTVEELYMSQSTGIMVL